MTDPEYAEGGGMLVPGDAVARVVEAQYGERLAPPLPARTFNLTELFEGPMRIDSDEPRDVRIGRELVEACERRIEEARVRAGHGPSKPPLVFAWGGIDMEADHERVRVALYGDIEKGAACG